MQATTTDHSPLVIELRDLYKVYKIEAQQVMALQKINLAIHRGRVVAICGKSGAGKSTLLHVIGTLDRPSRGEVLLNGTDVSNMPDKVLSSFRNCTVGLVFQMNNLLPEFSALENVMMPGLIAGADQREVKDRANRLLQAVGLENRGRHRPGELSGGEQQRVAIARALLMAPPILLADEPTGNLDQKTSEIIQELLLELCQAHEITMLLVTHDRDLAGRLPHRIEMEDGRIIEGGGVI